MRKTISSSDLRAQIKRVLNEVRYGQAQYVVEKFGEPTAAIVGMEDFRLLQEARKKQTAASLQELISSIRARSQGLDPDELDALIEEARAEFHHLQSSQAEIVRNVRENRTEYVVTYRGRPVAVLLPLDEEWMQGETGRAIASATPGEDVWEELEALRKEIGQSWQSEKTAVELVSEQRR